MSDQNLKPDLNEDSNVLDSHQDLIDASAASSRENAVRENGMEPVSLWILLACAVALMIGGAVIGKSGGISANMYDSYVVNGYVQSDPPGGGPVEMVPVPMIDAYAKNGAKIYQAKCQGCHQPTGMGDGAIYPPLGGSEWVTGETQALTQIILNGVMGPIEVAGRTWNGAMPGQAAGMTDKDLASLLTYIRNNFSNETGDVITTEMAANGIAAYKERAAGAAVPPPVQVAEIKSKYMVNLEGEAVDPQTLVDPKTLEPVE